MRPDGAGSLQIANLEFNRTGYEHTRRRPAVVRNAPEARPGGRRRSGYPESSFRFPSVGDARPHRAGCPEFGGPIG